MTPVDKTKFSRRELLKESLFAAGTLLVGFDKIRWQEPPVSAGMHHFLGGNKLGVVNFTEEATVPMGKVFGAELDGRMYTDLAKLSPDSPVTTTETFYIRTCASELLGSEKPWSLRIHGLLRRPYELSVAELEKMATPTGVHLMECAGNARIVHFGMMSVAEWTGVPVSKILENAEVRPGTTRVLISGFDRYATTSTSSTPGASWIFTLEELRSARAFLAMEMNHSRLEKNHGAPIRLVVPGWYGCTCIKWVNEIRIVDDAIPATSQMKEYASRTLQTGVPPLAKNYQPATIDQAAMPLRVEKWSVNRKVIYRVIGILWGGSQLVKLLQIRFNPEEDYVPVDHFPQTANDPWSFWSHAWRPKQTGSYIIRLRVEEPRIIARRLDAGYYVRTIDILEI